MNFNLEKPHHFYIVQGSADLEHNFRSVLDSSNNLFFKFEKMLVDDAREIIEMSSRKVSKDKKTFIIIFANSINVQTQNSMLKTLEEPIENLHHIWVTPNPHLLLDTILSRALFIPESDLDNTFGISISNKHGGYVSKIKKMNTGERIKFAEEIALKIKDGELSKNEAQKILREIIVELKSSPEVAKTLLKHDGYLNDSSASVKNILEFAVLALK